MKRIGRWLFRLLAVISPVLASKLLYRIVMKRKLDLKAPKTLNEKIVWLKLNDYSDNKLVSTCADKLRARDYVKEQGLEHILIPLIGTWESADEIQWDDLPESFVLKCNHGCGFNICCPDKDGIDEVSTKKALNKWLKTPFWRKLSELQYKKIKPCIVGEAFLHENDDYKLYCFHGEAKFILVCTQREYGNPKFYFFDPEWNLARINPDSLAAPADFTLPKPDKLDDMLHYAHLLSKPFPFVRVDFYIANDNIYFGEMTFTPSAGMDTSRLPETDIEMGNMLRLENIL